AERCIGECLQRLVQRRKLPRDSEQVLAGIEMPVQGVHLGAQAVEPLEQRIQLPVADVSFHAVHLRPSSSARVLTTAGSPPSCSSTRSRAPSPVSSKLTRPSAPRCESAMRASSSGTSV